MSRRVVSLWFQRLPSERVLRARPTEAPFALSLRQSNTTHIYCLNETASQHGLQKGMGLGEARVLCPGLQTAEAAPEADARFMQVLARWATQYCPWVAIEPDGLALDITGSAHLRGGEAPLLEDISTRLTRAGLSHRIGLADTYGTAWALARHGHGTKPNPTSTERSEAKAPQRVLPPAAKRTPSSQPSADASDGKTTSNTATPALKAQNVPANPAQATSVETTGAGPNNAALICGMHSAWGHSNTSDRNANPVLAVYGKSQIGTVIPLPQGKTTKHKLHSREAAPHAPLASPLPYAHPLKARAGKQLAPRLGLYPKQKLLAHRADFGPWRGLTRCAPRSLPSAKNTMPYLLLFLGVPFFAAAQIRALGGGHA
ncbi:MAG: hypothetical protein COB08_003315 [Rhodobacteraceae bacterium]|nr:hypothetical protein [Paracoccaceae bacterium]